MKNLSNFLVLILTVFGLCFFLKSQAHAIIDPLSVPNNKFGIHILFPSEVSDAAGLVNSNGGDYGYVTIPIQAHDRSIEKWQKFMDDCKNHHIIPIIRMASENYYFDTKVWRKPQDYDVLDFANFLNSLTWPTKNKYIVIYNEVNRSDEWQGSTNPQEYAQILSYAVDVFKTVDDDFFIISAGLDNASANVYRNSINQYDFMYEMENAVPGIFGKIDGLGSHSYPNPAFSEAPWVTTSKSISSFKYERNLAENFSRKKLPVFITETGWSRNTVSDNLIGSYIRFAFESTWSDSGIVAVTPFLLHAGSGPFEQFSLIGSNNIPNSSYLAIKSIPKVKGSPQLGEESSSNKVNLNPIPSPSVKKFTQRNQVELDIFREAKGVMTFFKWFLKSLNVI